MDTEKAIERFGKFCQYCGKEKKFMISPFASLVWQCPKWYSFIEWILGRATLHDYNIFMLNYKVKNFDRETGKRL